MMKARKNRSFLDRLKSYFIGGARDLYDQNVFHRVTLIAFFAWIGLGSDGMSSSCYGPEESYRALGPYPQLSVFVGIVIVITIFIIGSSYLQIIRLFPSGGGGYKVATKLLSPNLGMISGCALLVDYVLTISMSVSAGTDALFSLLPQGYQQYKLIVALLGVFVLLILNYRGVRESVFSLMPIFILFVVTHIFLILYSLLSNLSNAPVVYNQSISTFREATQNIGLAGVLMLMMRSYSMGAGTYTGLEAVSNSLPILKEPRVKTGLKTMRYMIISLGFTVLGLMFAYTLFGVHPSPAKTLNAVLLDSATMGWGRGWSLAFITVTLFSEAALLFIAAQTGFLDGPRVIASMAQDSWFPRRFTVLSDRLVTQNGISFMGIMALIIVLITHGSVRVLVILYSINVFITFALSQAGMVRHWWIERKSEKGWIHKLLINGIGLLLTVFILIMMVSLKFREGGWITLLITSLLTLTVTRIKKHYHFAGKLIARINHRSYHCVEKLLEEKSGGSKTIPAFDPDSKVAAICVSGYNGLGIQTFLKIKNEFKEYRNFVFIEVGIVDAGNFKGSSELKNLETEVIQALTKYKELAEKLGLYAETIHSIGTDVADEVKELAKKVVAKYPLTTFFVGQFIIPKATAIERMLHNQTQAAIQNRLAHKGYILVMIPVRSHAHI